MKLRSKGLGIILVVILFGGIAISTGLGYWKTKSSKQPVRFQEGAAEGEYNPADIRGSYTFGDISELFAIPLEELTTAFGVTGEENIADLRVSILEERYPDLGDDVEVGTGSVRLFVAWYLGLPYQTTGDEYLLMPAVRKLKSVASLTEEQTAYLDSHTVSPGSGQTDGPGTPVESEEDHEPLNDQMVRGKTTFRDLLDWGLTEDQIESILEMEMPEPMLTVRDFCTANGLEFGTIKLELQALIDGN